MRKTSGIMRKSGDRVIKLALSFSSRINTNYTRDKLRFDYFDVTHDLRTSGNNQSFTRTKVFRMKQFQFGEWKTNSGERFSSRPLVV